MNPRIRQAVEQLTAYTPGEQPRVPGLIKLNTNENPYPPSPAVTAVLRSMKRAMYSPKADGHYGLAKKYYAHFTSPIRRYPDLVDHRILAAALAGARPSYQGETIGMLAEHCSLTEQRAEQAERPGGVAQQRGGGFGP